MCFLRLVPENIPRDIKAVLLDLDVQDQNIDVESLQPKAWPRRHDTPPRVVRRDKTRLVFTEWLASRPERTVAVVCHYHVIRAALTDPWNASAPNASPLNAVPILCELDATCKLRLV
jgi:hypothetical protein